MTETGMDDNLKQNKSTRKRRRRRRPSQSETARVGTSHSRTGDANRQRAYSKTTSHSQRGRRGPIEKKASILSSLIRLLFNGIYYVIVITLIVSATLFALNRDTNKSYFGYRFFTVLTDSMVPKKDSPPGGFRSGDMIVVQSIDGRDAKPGDIVTFLVGDSQDRYLTHRLVETMTELNGEEGDFVVTRGDANNTDDPPFNAKKIVGKKVFVIPNVGFIAEFVRGNLWICLTFVLGLLGFLLVLRSYFFSDNRTRNKVSHY